MSTRMREGVIPEWTQGDRLRKARAHTGMNVSEFAQQMGVSDKTINNAEGGKHAVRQITLNAWALVTGVSLQWLMSGIGSPTPDDGATASPDNAATARLAAAKRTRNTRKGEVTPRYLDAA